MKKGKISAMKIIFIKSITIVCMLILMIAPVFYNFVTINPNVTGWQKENTYLYRECANGGQLWEEVYW